jgi:hypothetical protein
MGMRTGRRWCTSYIEGGQMIKIPDWLVKAPEVLCQEKAA